MKRIVAISISLFSYMVLVLSLNGQREIGHPAFMSPHFSPIVISQDKVFVANTPCDTIGVLDAKSGGLFRRIPSDLIQSAWPFVPMAVNSGCPITFRFGQRDRSRSVETNLHACRRDRSGHRSGDQSDPF